GAPAALPEVPGRVRTLSPARSPRPAIRPATAEEPGKPEAVPAGSTPVPETASASPAGPAASVPGPSDAGRTPEAPAAQSSAAAPPSPSREGPAAPAAKAPIPGGPTPRPPEGPAGPGGAPPASRPMRNLGGPRLIRPEGGRRPPIRTPVPIRIAP